MSSGSRAVEEKVVFLLISLMPAIDWAADESSSGASFPFCSRESAGVLMTMLFSDISGVPMIGEQVSSMTRKRALVSLIGPIWTEQHRHPYTLMELPL